MPPKGWNLLEYNSIEADQSVSTFSECKQMVGIRFE